VSIDRPAKNLSTPWHSGRVNSWKVSKVMPKKGDVRQASQASLKNDKLGWHIVRASGAPEGFINIHDALNDADGLVYFANRFDVKKAGSWKLHLGHDGGAKVFVDGKAVLCEPTLKNPALPGRSEAAVSMAKGKHEIVIAFDTHAGGGWGIFLCFELVKPSRKPGVKAWFPQLA
jgi:hypothetical protein